MQSKLSTVEKEPNHLPPKDQELRRAFSDRSTTTKEVIQDMNLTMKTNNEIEKVECECCGLSEDCTPTYIGRIKEFFCGKWVCGLCSEAVKEKMKRTPSLAMEEALESHIALCKQFNGTTRLNPKLSLAGAMRDIARKSSQHRTNSKDHCAPKIGRTVSCVPRMDVEIRRSPIQ